MNDAAMAQAVQEKTRAKFRGNKALKSKVQPHFPVSLSREYETIVNGYMRLVSQTLKEHLPTIRRAITEERAAVRDGMRRDSDLDVSRMIERVMVRAREDFEKKAVTFGLDAKLAALANTMRKRSVREWKRIVHRTLGINILEDYYMGEFYRGTLRQWTTNNIALIKSMPGETMTRMTNIIQGGYLQGKTNAEMSKQIQEAYGVEKKKADFLARDQTSKLNAELTQQQQKDAGVEEYVWTDSDDGRVRDCHKHLHDKSFKWNDPPEMWYVTKKRGRVHTGRRCHPGQDYRCRCVALPKFHLATLNLPWEGGG